MQHTRGDVDLLSAMDDSTTVAMTEDLGMGPEKEYKLGSDGSRLEKPFNEENTLDEPVTVTIVETRDLKMIKTKFLYIMGIQKPDDLDKELKNWDLWGPFAICLIFSVTLYWKGKTTSPSSIFSTVFFLVALGAFGITLNAKLLGSRQSLFQDVSVVGYCVGPLIAGSLAFDLNLWNPLILAINAACVYWAIKCSFHTVARDLGKDKRMLAAVPLVLFFILLDWIILIL